MTNIIYANIPQRVKAAMIDTIIIIVLLYGVSELFLLFENAPNEARIFAFICVLVLYDPLLTTIYGGTMGHSFIGIEVKRASNTTKNLSFPMAVVRYLLKTALGWISLLTASGNANKQAIHDLVVSSVVLEERK